MIPLPSQTKIISRKKNKTIFSIEGFYPGYGVTLGNGLRRILLSSLEGAAVTQVKIKGVAHEFSTLPGVLEDTITILMNLKRLRLKMYTDESQSALLAVSGIKDVKASDFKFPAQVKIINKEAPIATLTSKKASLEMEIKIEKGVGYEPVERRKKEKLEIGVISLDAIYTPIKNVSFHTENMRVGERTDFDRLILEVETDGTISPEEAFGEACRIFSDHLAAISRLDEKTSKKKTQAVKKAKVSKETKTPSQLKVEEMGFGRPLIKVLSENKIRSAAGLAQKSEKELLKIKGLGPKAVEIIKKKLKATGLKLKQD
jgi:DNA-directed RNA polymerase subunit alpha